MKARIITLTVVALLILGTATISAQGPGQRLRGDFEDFPELTSEQKERMADLRSDHKKLMIPRRADLKLLMVEYREMMRDDASQSRLESKLDEIGTLRTEISKMRLDHRLKMKSVLTDEQIQFLKDHLRMMKFLHGKQKGHRGHDCDRPGRGDKGFGGPRFHGEEFDDDEFEESGFGFLGCLNGGHGNCDRECPRF